MSRWIDADEAEKWLRAGCAYVIRKLPTIDIVRCSECVHWRKDKFFCTQWTCGTPAVGWCYMAKQTERSE